MDTLIEPNMHPILVHFTYGLMTAGALSLLLAALFSKSSWGGNLKIAADWMITLGAVALIATIAAGFEAYYSVSHDGPSHAAMTIHRNWAVPTGLALLVLTAWRWRNRAQLPSVLFSLMFVAAALSLSVTAWWGGKLVYGYGLGVASLPSVTGDGHDHDHDLGESDVATPAAGSASIEEHGEEGHHDNGAESKMASAPSVESGIEPVKTVDAQYPETPLSVVESFGEALRAGDEKTIRAILLPDVLIAEGGGAERSLEEYAGHHMPADMEFTAAVESALKKRDVIEANDMTIIISESQIHGQFRETKIHSKMIETIALKKVNDKWRIAHIHWSSAPITGEHEH